MRKISSGAHISHLASLPVPITSANYVSLQTSMIVGTGIDVAEVQRIRDSIQRFGSRFLSRIYTAEEQAYCLHKRRNAAESFAARFAAKEACAKALGTGISRGISWLEIEVVRAPGQRPTLRLHGRAMEWAARLRVTHLSLSLTHSSSLAIASVVLESDSSHTPTT